MIVCKFGGSATTNLNSVKNILQLKQKSKARKVFVFSAIGRQNSNDIKVTDLLINYTKTFDKNTKNLLCKKFENLCQITGVKINIKKIINKYINNLKINNDISLFVSRGEHLTAFIMSKYLNIKFIPAEQIIYFYNSKINYKKTQKKLQYYLSKYNQIVVPGFYGINQHKQVVLFPRGGGDVTGAIVAKVIKKCTYENWTDVNGIMQVNPSIMQSKQIPQLNYKQLNILTSHDACVVHNLCAKILYKTKVKIKINNIQNIQNKPTVVTRHGGKNVSFVCYKPVGKIYEVYVLSKHKKVIKKYCPKSLLNQTIKNLYLIYC